VLVPYRVRWVLNDASTRHGGLKDRNGDVWIAGDDLAVATMLTIGFSGSLMVGLKLGSAIEAGPDPDSM
jgi:hypothetical protein